MKNGNKIIAYVAILIFFLAVYTTAVNANGSGESDYGRHDGD
jgi:hypothetical protein